MPLIWPSAEQALSLHRRLCDGEATAPSDFAVAYAEVLGAWVRTKNTRADEDQCQDAAHRAVLSVIRQPHCYDPDRGALAAYLRMSVLGDLRNLIQRERRHQRRRILVKNVEEVADAGKYREGTDDDETGRGVALLASVRESLTEADQRCFDLMCDGEKRTALFAAAAGCSHLSPPEQAREVKRVKDRIKKRIQRAGGEP